MFSEVVNGIKIYAPKSREALIEHAIKHQKILVAINAEHRLILKPEGLLTRDPRMVERKKFGQKKARKKFQFSKR